MEAKTCRTLSVISAFILIGLVIFLFFQIDCCKKPVNTTSDSTTVIIKNLKDAVKSDSLEIVGYKKILHDKDSILTANFLKQQEQHLVDIREINRIKQLPLNKVCYEVARNFTDKREIKTVVERNDTTTGLHPFQIKEVLISQTNEKNYLRENMLLEGQINVYKAKDSIFREIMSISEKQLTDQREISNKLYDKTNALTALYDRECKKNKRVKLWSGIKTGVIAVLLGIIALK